MTLFFRRYILIALFASQTLAGKTQPVVLSDSIESYNLTEYSDYILIEKDDSPTKKMCESASWMKFQDKAVLLSYHKKAFLVRVIVQNNSSNTNYVFTCEQPTIDHFEILNSQFVSLNVTGDTYPWTTREYKESFPTFSFHSTVNQCDTAYLKIYMAEEGIAPLNLKTTSNYLQFFAHREWISGIFIGLMGVIAIYNLFLFFSINDRLYLYYSLYVLCMAFAQTSIFGNALGHNYGSFDFISKVDSTFFPSLAAIMGYTFILKYFEFIKHPWIRKMLVFTIILFIIIAFLSLACSHLIAELQAVFNFLYPFSYFLAFYLAGVSLSAKYHKELSLIFFVGWTTLFLGGTFFSLTNLGLIDYKPFLYYLMPVGVAFETIVLSLALGYRMKLLKKEKIEVYNSLILQKERSAKLELQSKEVELSSLRKQMNPHFMFNSLNSIQNLILKEDTESASDYLVKFAKLMRKNLLFADTSEITIDEEIRFLTSYLEIEKLRFKNRFNFYISVDQDINIETVKTPPLFIQTFVENAVKHAFCNETINGKIYIRFKKENSLLVVEIEDNGCGLHKAKIIKEHKSKGITITHKRIALLNMDMENEITLDIKDKVTIDPMTTGLLVVLKFPFV